MNYDEMKKVAEDHVTWFLGAIKPLLVDNFVHGMKHGISLSGSNVPDHIAAITPDNGETWKGVGNELRESIRSMNDR